MSTSDGTTITKAEFGPFLHYEERRALGIAGIMVSLFASANIAAAVDVRCKTEAGLTATQIEATTSAATSSMRGTAVYALGYYGRQTVYWLDQNSRR